MNARKTQNVGRTATTGDAQSTNNADCMPTSIDNSYETAVIKKKSGARAQNCGGRSMMRPGQTISNNPMKKR